MTQKLLLFLFCQFFFLTAVPQQTDNNTRPVLIFRSGFEPGSMVIPSGADADISGKDLSVEAPNDWIEDFDKHPEVGNFSLQYQGGTNLQRIAKIIADRFYEGSG